MHLLPAEFNAFFNDFGQRVSWRKAYDCPCVDPHSGAAQAGCPVCGAKGKIWDEPVDGVLALSGQKVQQKWAAFGLYESGDVVVSIPSDSPLYGAGQYDRVVLLDTTRPFSTHLIRGEIDRLRIPNAVCDRCFWIVDGAIVEGAPPAVDAANALSWTEAPAPPDGMTYSLSGRGNPEYYVLSDYPQDRAHFGGRELPRKVVLRLMDLFGR